MRLSEYICGGADQFAWVRHALIADLFDEEGMMELLVRFGINPWREATYDFQTRCFRMLHSKLFESSETIAFEQVRDWRDSADESDAQLKQRGRGRRSEWTAQLSDRHMRASHEERAGTTTCRREVEWTWREELLALRHCCQPRERVHAATALRRWSTRGSGRPSVWRSSVLNLRKPPAPSRCVL